MKKKLYKACKKPTRKPDYISGSGSEYWYLKNGGHIRFSDHWGKNQPKYCHQQFLMIGGGGYTGVYLGEYISDDSMPVDRLSDNINSKINGRYYEERIDQYLKNRKPEARQAV